MRFFNLVFTAAYNVSFADENTSSRQFSRDSFMLAGVRSGNCWFHAAAFTLLHQQSHAFGMGRFSVMPFTIDGRNSRRRRL